MTATTTAGTVRLDPGERPDPVLVAASLAASGWPVLALWPASKRPMHAGSGAHNHRDHWLADPAAVLVAADDAAEVLRGRSPNFAAMTGQPGGDGLALVALDLDGDSADLADLLAEGGPEAVEWAGATLRVQRCPERMHLWGLARADNCPPTVRLAAGLEWRAGGGYVLLPGSVHPSGARYGITRGRVEFTSGAMPPRTVYRGVVGPDAEGVPSAAWTHVLPVPEALLNVIAARGDRGPRPAPAPPEVLGAGSEDLTASRALSRLEGAVRWLGASEVGERNDRLNKAAGLVAGLIARVPEAERSGDLEPTVWRQKLIDVGVGIGLDRREAERTTTSGWRWGSANPVASAGEWASSPLPKAGGEPVALGTPWVDLSTLTTTGRLPDPPRPAHLTRADGARFFYEGRVNRLFGDYESGKTWVLLATDAEVLGDGGRVAHIDVDHMGAAEIVRRLALLGVPLGVLGDPGRFRLYEPEDAAGLLAASRDVAAWAPDLAGVDSLGEVLPMLALSSNAPDDFTTANRNVMQPMADAGCCVVVIDHLAKGLESRRQGPTGTIAKGRPVRGVSLRVRVVRAFAPGRGGASALTVEKDTPGAVRAACPPGGRGGEQAAGVFRLSPRGDDPDAAGSLLWSVDVPTPGDLKAADLALVDPEAMERVSRALEHAGAPMTQNRIQLAAKVRRGDVASLLDHLARGGYIRRVVRGQSKLSEHVRPFVAADFEGRGDDA